MRIMKKLKCDNLPCMEVNPNVPVGMGNERLIHMNNTQFTTDIFSTGTFETRVYSLMNMTYNLASSLSKQALQRNVDLKLGWHV